MSVSYSAENTLVNATWVALLLSERDVAGQIPINFVTNPAVWLSSACFGAGLYDREDAAKCISNLLAIGYRRLVVDLYWSVEHRIWTFCPVAIPARADVTVSTYISTTADLPVTAAVTSTATSTAAGNSAPTITGYSDSHGSTVYELGPYRCTDGLDLYSLVQVLVGYFQDTTSALTTYTNYLVLNLHVAASTAAPTKPPPAVAGADLPSSDGERVGSILFRSLGEFLYSPAQLAEDRSNLNRSWYEVEQSFMPITEYFTIHKEPSGIQSTPDGWPSSKYVQLAKEDRVLIEYGSVDAQLAAYDLSQDEDAIFPAGSMISDVQVSVSSNGTLTSGCIYDPGATKVSQANSSWAMSNDIPVLNGPSPDGTLKLIPETLFSLTSCGISPGLNSMLLGQTADANVDPYRNVSLSAGWAWAVGEPQGAGTGGGSPGQPKFDRCAIMDVSLHGRWRATNCTEQRRGACRVGNSPFVWRLSNATADYRDVSGKCPPGSAFAVPRTGLENTYLYNYLLTQSSSLIDPSSTDPTLREVYINFNSIDVTACWVAGGPHSTCPYASDPQELERRTVLVGAIAGIVICIITALTLFVKCNANRRNSRRRKRVIEGWDYEGVPS